MSLDSVPVSLDRLPEALEHSDSERFESFILGALGSLSQEREGLPSQLSGSQRHDLVGSLE